MEHQNHITPYQYEKSKVYQYIDADSLLIYNFLTVNDVSKITSKRQITIPVHIYNEANLSVGQKLVFSVQNDGSILIKSPINTINKLSRSIKVSADLKGKDIDETIKKAKYLHHKNKFSR